VANTITGLVPTLYEALDTVSREFIGFIPAVYRDNGNFQRAAKGQTVSVFIAPSVTASDITPGVTAPNDGDQVINTVNLTIAKSRYVPVRWNGEEQLGLNNNGPNAHPIMVEQFAQAYRALANEIENDLYNAAYKASSRAVGTAGATPFATAADLSSSALAAQILDDNGAPALNRSLVINSAAMAKLRGVQTVLFKVNEAGTAELLRQGTIGRLEGFDIHYSAGIKPVIKGTGTSYTSSAAGFPVGTTAIPIITGSGTVLAGDIVTFAGDTNNYVVVTGVAAPGTITIGSPGLRVALAASAVAMTIGGTASPGAPMNIAFTRDAMVLATRMPAVPTDMNGRANDMADDRVMIQDPFSGIGFEVSLYRQYRQIKFEVALAWGTGAVKQEHIATLLG
jgi:hypothetical protein